MANTGHTQVLTFTLGEEEYCIPIEYVAEIVDEETIRSLPGSSEHVEGITNLRGETTTIVNPTDLLNVDTETLLTDGGQTENRIVVLDSEALGTESPTGWLVSDVDKVTEVDNETLDTEAVAQTECLEGLIKNEDGFTLWLDPHKFTA